MKKKLITLLAFTWILLLSCNLLSRTNQQTVVNYPELQNEETINSQEIQDEDPAGLSEMDNGEDSPTLEDYRVKKDIYAVGDYVYDNPVKFIIVGWDLLPLDYQYTNSSMKPQEGKTFLIIDIVILNLSNTEKSFYNKQHFIQDSQGTNYELSYITNSIKRLTLPDLFPGETARINLFFEIPFIGESWTYLFEGVERWGENDVIVNLGSNPTLVEIPRTIPGEEDPPMAPFKEFTEIGFKGDTYLQIVEVVYSRKGDYKDPPEGYQLFCVYFKSAAPSSGNGVGYPSIDYVKTNTRQYYSPGVGEPIGCPESDDILDVNIPELRGTVFLIPIDQKVLYGVSTSTVDNLYFNLSDD